MWRAPLPESARHLSNKGFKARNARNFNVYKVREAQQLSKRTDTMDVCVHLYVHAYIMHTAHAHSQILYIVHASQQSPTAGYSIEAQPHLYTFRTSLIFLKVLCARRYLTL